MYGMRDSVHVSSGGTSASLSAAFTPRSRAVSSVTSPGHSPTIRCQPDIGYAGIDMTRRQVSIYSVGLPDRNMLLKGWELLERRV